MTRLKPDGEARRGTSDPTDPGAAFDPSDPDGLARGLCELYAPPTPCSLQTEIVEQLVDGPGLTGAVLAPSLIDARANSDFRVWSHQFSSNQPVLNDTDLEIVGRGAHTSSDGIPTLDRRNERFGARTSARRNQIFNHGAIVWFPVELNASLDIGSNFPGIATSALSNARSGRYGLTVSSVTMTIRSNTAGCDVQHHRTT